MLFCCVCHGLPYVLGGIAFVAWASGLAVLSLTKLLSLYLSETPWVLRVVASWGRRRLFSAPTGRRGFVDVRPPNIPYACIICIAFHPQARAAVANGPGLFFPGIPCFVGAFMHARVLSLKC